MSVFAAANARPPAQRGALRAILGGTFDPVHVGHLRAALVGGALLGARQVELLLAARPWHRETPGADAAHRWAMLRLAAADANAGRLPTSVGRLASTPRLVASDRELTGESASRTVATLEMLAARGDGRPVWLLGADAAAGIHAWRRAEALPKLCHLLVLARPSQCAGALPTPIGFERMNIAELRERPCGGVHFAAAPMLDVSATGIRAAVAAGAADPAVGALLTPRVWAYIRRCALYAADSRSAAGVGDGRRPPEVPRASGQASGQGGGPSTRHK